MWVWLQRLKGKGKFSMNFKSFSGGALGFLGSVILLLIVNSSFMNFSKTKKPTEVVKFEIKKQKITKKMSKPKPKAKPKKSPSLKPDLKSMIAGMSFGIPAFEMELGSGSDFLNQGGYMNGSKVDQKPKVIYRADLDFPEEAVSENQSGFVTFGVFIDEEGNLKKLDVLESHPEGVFEKAAMTSLKKWKFKPAVHKGIKVATWQEQKIIFNAEES